MSIQSHSILSSFHVVLLYHVKFFRPISQHAQAYTKSIEGQRDMHI